MTPGKYPNTMYTDACKQGWGAVIFTTEGDVLTIGAQWTSMHASRTINELEAQAVFNAVTHFWPQLRGKPLQLYVDNTSVIGALNKGYSPSFNLNKQILKACNALQSIPVTIRYIHTSINPADAPSRDPTASLYGRMV